MNQQAYEAGKNAYKQGDLATAVAQLTAAKAPGEVSGAIDHLLGNCLMKLGRFSEAANSYADALRDVNYGHSGALACNRGRALIAAGKPQEAIASLTLAVKDEGYATPYKAYTALGNAYMRVGNVRDAGVAYRNAAIDEKNPDPSFALRSLGGCFMQMGRAVDAVEAYRTALDFSSPQSSKNAIYGDLGLAYVAANRMAEAVDAFNRATADGSYTLRPEAQAAYDAAKKAVSAITDGGPSETDAFLAAAGYGTGAAIDPLDPTGQTGEFMPSPEDTGFFSVKEEDLVAQDKKARKERKVRRKKSHRGLKVFLTILIILLIAAGAAGFAYYKGYGFPTQQSVVEDLFEAGASGKDISPYLESGLSSEERTQIKSLLPTGSSSVSIDGLDKSMSKSTVMATATLSAGGEQSYKISLVRDGVTWKVKSIAPVYASGDGKDTSVSDTSTSAAATTAQNSGTDVSTSDASASEGASTGTISTGE